MLFIVNIKLNPCYCFEFLFKKYRYEVEWMSVYSGTVFIRGFRLCILQSIDHSLPVWIWLSHQQFWIMLVRFTFAHTVDVTSLYDFLGSPGWLILQIYLRACETKEVVKFCKLRSNIPAINEAINDFAVFLFIKKKQLQVKHKSQRKLYLFKSIIITFEFIQACYCRFNLQLNDKASKPE